MGAGGCMSCLPWHDYAHSRLCYSMWFKERAEEAGFKQAVKERDSGDPIAPDAERPSLGPLSRL